MNHFPTAHPELDQPVLTTLCHPEQKTFRRSKTILLAEDDQDLRYVMELGLTAMGFSVISASDAYLAASAFRSYGTIDLLLTDYEMPGRTGVELARELTGLRPSLPVMILSGSFLLAATLTEINARHWTFVSKPCHLVALEASLRRALGAGGLPEVQTFAA